MKIDEKSYWVIENNAPPSLQHVKVFSADNWHDPAAGKIRNLKIQTEGNFIRL